MQNATIPTKRPKMASRKGQTEVYSRVIASSPIKANALAPNVAPRRDRFASMWPVAVSKLLPCSPPSEVITGVAEQQTVHTTEMSAAQRWGGVSSVITLSASTLNLMIRNAANIVCPHKQARVEMAIWDFECFLDE